MQLPLIVEPLELVEPGWDLDVKHLGDVFLSAGIGDERLGFSAVDSNGTTLWQAQRPTGLHGIHRDRRQRRESTGGAHRLRLRSRAAAPR